MPPSKQPRTPKTPPVRADATTAPAPATAPAEAVADAVAGTTKGGRASAGTTPARKKPAAKKPAAKGAAAADAELATPPAPERGTKAAPAGRAAKPKPKAPAKAGAKPKAPTKPKAATKPKAPAKPRAAAATSKSRPAAEPAPAPEPTSAAARDEALRANLASLRDLLAGGVVLTAQRLQEAVDEAVTRGRITRRDAEDLASGLLNAGRQQTQDLLADLEALLGRGRTDLSSRSSITKATVKGSERVLREVDRARRAAGIGTAFPILGYDELTGAQVIKRLPELTAAELRKVRDHEQRSSARATVLKAIEDRLA